MGVGWRIRALRNAFCNSTVAALRYTALILCGQDSKTEVGVMCTKEPPTTEEQYIEWAKATIGVDFNKAAERLYESKAALALVTAQKHDFFVDLDSYLQGQQQQYHANKDSDLLMGVTRVTLSSKPYESAVNKSFRHNVVHNRRWPEEPEGGWLTPDNWFANLNDLIRSTVVCKYIDGPGLLAKLLHERADEFNLESGSNSKQRDGGYYAYHFYVGIPVELSAVDSGDGSLTGVWTNIDVELQLTTQLQEVLYDITHRFYERTRDKRSEDPNAWKWDTSSNRFKAGYVGHTLHLLEAIIIELRDAALLESDDHTAGGD